MGLTDIHLHLLPGLDDGPPTLPESLAHARRLVAAGVHEAVVTPHVGHPRFDVPVDEIGPRTSELQGHLDEHGLRLRLHPGGEIHASAADRLEPFELEAIAHGPPGRRWVLLEPPFEGIDAGFVASCARLRELGYAPVIAHPERSRGFLPDGFPLLRAELARGARAQVSVCSLLGHHGPVPRAVAGWLLRSGRAAAIASDGHGGRRSHTLGQAQELALWAGVTPSRAQELTSSAPARLLARGVPVALPVVQIGTPVPAEHPQRSGTGRAEGTTCTR